MVTLTKKQLWKENDEWVVVGLKQNKSMEKGWVLVPDKNKGPPVDEPDRVDKILARYASRAKPTPSVPSRSSFHYSKTKTHPSRVPAGTACASARKPRRSSGTVASPSRATS